MAMTSADMKIRADLNVRELRKLLQTLITLTFVFPRQKTISVLMAAVATKR